MRRERAQAPAQVRYCGSASGCLVAVIGPWCQWAGAGTRCAGGRGGSRRPRIPGTCRDPQGRICLQVWTGPLRRLAAFWWPLAHAEGLGHPEAHGLPAGLRAGPSVIQAPRAWLHLSVRQEGVGEPGPAGRTRWAGRGRTVAGMQAHSAAGEVSEPTAPQKRRRAFSSGQGAVLPWFARNNATGRRGDRALRRTWQCDSGP
jgi:hypothetical protein